MLWSRACGRFKTAVDWATGGHPTEPTVDERNASIFAFPKRLSRVPRLLGYISLFMIATGHVQGTSKARPRHDGPTLNMLNIPGYVIRALAEKGSRQSYFDPLPTYAPEVAYAQLLQFHCLSIF